MGKKSKISTPEWILEGYDSKEEWEKAKGRKSASKSASSGQSEKERKIKKSGKHKKGEKNFTMKKCPQCGSYNIGVVLSGKDIEEESSTGKEWECHQCGWKGEDPIREEVSEAELIKLSEESK